jgi:hypothetical protein
MNKYVFKLEPNTTIIFSPGKDELMVVNCWQPGEELAYWEDNYTDSTLPAGSQTLQRGVNEDRVDLPLPCFSVLCQAWF